MKKTLYDLLNVPRDADDDALNRAYRKAAKAHHPDLNAGDPNASRRFKQIAVAVEILRNPRERAAYDRWLDRERLRLRQSRVFIAQAIATALVTVVLAGGYALIEPAFSTSAMVSEAEDNADNAVQPAIAMLAEQRIPPAEPADSGVERGRLEQGPAIIAVSVSGQLPAAERGAGVGSEPGGRQPDLEAERRTAGYEAAVRSEQDESRQAARRERPQAERQAAPRPEQTCKRDGLGCGRNRPVVATLREEPKARASAALAETPRNATPARRTAPAQSPALPNAPQRAGAGIFGFLQHCLL